MSDEMIAAIRSFIVTMFSIWVLCGCVSGLWLVYQGKLPWMAAIVIILPQAFVATCAIRGQRS